VPARYVLSDARLAVAESFLGRILHGRPSDALTGVGVCVSAYDDVTGVPFDPGVETLWRAYSHVTESVTVTADAFPRRRDAVTISFNPSSETARCHTEQAAKWHAAARTFSHVITFEFSRHIY